MCVLAYAINLLYLHLYYIRVRFCQFFEKILDFSPDLIIITCSPQTPESLSSNQVLQVLLYPLYIQGMVTDLINLNQCPERH
jgi:hypothetical protein